MNLSANGAGDDVLQLPAAWIMKQDIVADDRLYLMASGHVREIVKPQAIIRATAQAQRNVSPVPEDCGDLPELACISLVGLIRDHDGNQASGIPLPPRLLPSESWRVSLE